MPVVTVAIAVMIFVAGALAGGLGALLGIGGGVFLVPFLTIGFNFPFTSAAAISLTTVIATSSAVTAGRRGQHLINLRLAMVLEVATVAGSVLGAFTAQHLKQATLEKTFGVVAVFVAAIMISRMRTRNVILDPSVDPGVLGGRYYEDESGGIVTYRVRRLPAALAASFVAGNVSSLLGIGGGVIKVPALNAWCGVPLRAAAATSAFMIGVTATSGAVVYYGHGQLNVPLAAATVLGVQLGSWSGLRLGAKTQVKWLKLMMAIVLLIVSALMFVRGLQ